MDAGAWWAAIYGVAQSRTRLKRLSSSSSRQKYSSSFLKWKRQKQNLFPRMGMEPWGGFRVVVGGGWCRCPAPSVPTGPPSIPAGRWMLALGVSLQPPLSFPLGGKGSPGGFQHLCQLQSWPGLLFALSILFSASPLSLLTKLVSEPIFPAPPSSGVPIPEWVDRTEGYGFAFPFLTAWMTCYTLRTYRQ